MQKEIFGLKDLVKSTMRPVEEKLFLHQLLPSFLSLLAPAAMQIAKPQMPQ
jgi:hypothetical protein